MPKQALNKTWIDRQPFSQKGPVDYYDTGCTGLILRIGAKRKTFYHNLPTDGKRGMKKIGHFSYTGRVGLTHEGAVREIERIKFSGARRHTGFSNSHLRDYIDNHYRQDRLNANKPVSDKTIDDIKRYYAHTLDRPCSKLSDDDYVHALKEFPHLSDASKRKMYYVFSALLNTLADTDRIATNPLKTRSFKAFEPRSINTHDVKYEDVYKFIFKSSSETVRRFGWHSKLITALCIETGARPGEIRKSKLSSLRLSDPAVHLEILPEVSKNNQFRRVVILSETIIDALNQYVTHHYVANPDDYLFYSKRSRSCPSSSVYRALWGAIKDEFALRGRFYDFRHTFANKTYKHTGDIALVAELIGDDISTAVKYYTQTAEPSDVKNRLEGME